MYWKPPVRTSLEDLHFLRASQSAFNNFVNFRFNHLHVPLRRSEWFETEGRVEFVRVARNEVEPAQALKLRMHHDTFDEPFAEAASAMAFQHIHVTQICERGVI